MKRVLTLAGLALGMGAMVFFVLYAQHTLQGQDLARLTQGGTICGMLLACGAYMATIPTAAWGLQALLQGAAVPTRLAGLTQMLAISQLGKYLPGNVGAHAGRAAMMIRDGIPTKTVMGTMLIEAILVAGTALLLGIGALGLTGRALPIQASPSMCLALGGLGAIALGGLWWLQKHRMGWLELFSLPHAMKAALAYVAVYCQVGLGLWLLALFALPQSNHAPLVLGASFALGWVAGFFTPGAPAGLGVREGVMLLVLHGAYSSKDALFLIIAFRISTLVADGLLFALGLASRLVKPSPLKRAPLHET